VANPAHGHPDLPESGRTKEMRMTDPESKRLLDDVARESEARRARQLADAKAKAAESGKEPFDLSVLERLADTTHDGQVTSVEHRVREYEYMYYVIFPELTSMEELGKKVNQLNQW